MNSDFQMTDSLEFTFEYTNQWRDDVMITGFKNDTNGHVIIPSKINGIEVTEINIAYSASEFCSGITSISIPESVTKIHLLLFDYCINLLTISVNESNSKYSAFDGLLLDKSKTALIRCCRAKQGEVTIPDSAIEINAFAFNKCNGLTTISIPDSLTEIGDYAFYGCTSLRTITIPNSVINIGENAFSDCAVLASINIPNSLTEIGKGAYGGCASASSC